MEKAELKLWVGGLPGKITRQRVHEYFSSYGEVDSVYLIKSNKEIISEKQGFDFKRERLCKGFAYVTLKNSEDFQRILGMQALVFEGRTLNIQRPVLSNNRKKYKQAQSKLRVFLPKLPANLGEAELKKYFSKFGSLESVYKIKNLEMNTFKTYGYLKFENQISAENVLSKDFHVVSGYKIGVLPFRCNYTSVENINFTTDAEQLYSQLSPKNNRQKYTKNGDQYYDSNNEHYYYHNYEQSYRQPDNYFSVLPDKQTCFESMRVKQKNINSKTKTFLNEEKLAITQDCIKSPDSFKNIFTGESQEKNCNYRINLLTRTKNKIPQLKPIQSPHEINTSFKKNSISIRHRSLVI